MKTIEKSIEETKAFLDAMKKYYPYEDTIGAVKTVVETAEKYQKMKPVYDLLVEHFGEQKDILDNPNEIKKWLERVTWHVKKCDELGRKYQKIEKIAEAWDSDCDIDSYDSMAEIKRVIDGNNSI